MHALYTPRLLGSLVLVIGFFATLAGCEWFSPAKEISSTEKQLRAIYALGHLEPATGVIDIRATPGDRLKKLINIVEDEIAPEDQPAAGGCQRFVFVQVIMIATVGGRALPDHFLDTSWD